MTSAVRLGLLCILSTLASSNLRAATPLSLGTTYAGSLALAGQTNTYTFNGLPGQRLFYDSLDTDSLRMNTTLLSPGGSVIYQRNDDFDSGPLVLNEPGTYSLVLNADGSTTGFYEFRLLDLSAAPALALGAVLDDQLSPPLSCNIYQFGGLRGQRIDLQALSYSTNQAQWQLVTPANVVLVSGPINQNLGTVTLPLDGPYCLMVMGTAPGTTPLTFQVLVSKLNDTSVAATGFGTVNSGTIAANQTNSFTYTAPAGLPVYFDSVDHSGQSLGVDLMDPSGKAVFSIAETSDAGPYVLPLSGSYTLNVRGPGGASGNFSFRLLDLSASPALTLSAVTSNNLSLPYQTDVYKFNVTAGQKIYYDGQGSSAVNIQVFLLGPDGQNVLSTPAYYDAGPVTLPFSGTYYFFVQNPSANAGSYQFNLFDVGAQPTLLVNTDLVGTLPANGSAIYNLAGNKGQQLYFYAKSAAVAGALWTLYDPRNALINSANVGRDFLATLPYPGNYVLVLSGGATPAFYSNQVVSFTIVTNALTLNTTVTNNLFNPGDQLVYTFTGSPGQMIYYDALNTVFPSLTASLLSPGGVNLISFNPDYNVGPVVLPQTGTYRLVIAGNANAIGPVTFQLLDVASQPALARNTDLVGNLGPYATQIYQVTGTNAEHLYFDAKLFAPGAYWTLYGGDAAAVGSASLSTDFEPILPRTGFYALVLENNTANSLSFSNRVNTFTYTTNALTLGAAVTNNIVNPGDQVFYTFSGTVGQRLYFDSLAPYYASSAVTLFSPSGLTVGTWSLGSDSGTLITLPESGVYTLQIDGYSDAVTPVSFSLVDVGVQPTLALNTVLTTTLAPYNSVFYQINGVSGQQLYFDSQGGSGNGGTWSLYGPDNRSLNENNLSADFEQTLPFTGPYVLVFSAAANPLNYTNEVNTFGYVTNALSLGNAVTTAVVHPGDQLYYTFNGSVGQRIYFDSRQTNGSGFVATLLSPSGATVFSVNSVSDAGPYTLTQAGTYALVLDGSSDATGSTSFQLLDLASATATTVGSTITDALDDQTQTKFYKFNGTVGQRVNLQGLSTSGNQALWGLIGPGDAALGSQTYISGNVGTVLLPVTGTYTIAVIGYGQKISPVNYQLSIADVSDAPVVNSGFGVVHSGNLAAGQTNSFTYTASAGTVVLFDSQDRSGQSLLADLIAPDGTAAFSIGEINDSAPTQLPQSGTYTLNIRGSQGASGNYGFRLLDLGASPALVLNSAVSTTLSNPYQTDVYQVSASVGQRLYYDALTNDVNYPSVSIQFLDWRDQNLALGGDFQTDRGPFTVPHGGTYYLLFQSSLGTPAAYAFRLLDVSAQPALALNSSVTNTLGVYAARVYQYAGTAGQRLYFLAQPTNPAGGWNLYDPNNAIVNGSGNSLASDLEVLLPVDGQYTLIQYSSAAADATEIFTLTDFTYTTNSYTLGASISDSINQSGNRHYYTFTGTVGQELFYDALTNDPVAPYSVSATLLNPQGVNEGPIAGIRFSFDRGPFKLQESGIYTLVIDGIGATIAPFGFRLLDVSAQPLLPINSVVTNTIDVYTSQVFRYQGAAGQRLYFHAQSSNPSGFWTLYDPVAASVPGGSGGLAGDFEVTLPLTGSYALVLGSYSSTASPESFQVNDYTYFTNAYTLGSAVVDSIARPGEKHFYTFTGAVGQRLIYNALTNDPANSAVITVQLIDPSGQDEGQLGGRFSINRGPFVLQQSGTYTLVLDGIDAATGAYAFQLLDITAQSALPVSVSVTNTLPVFPLQVYQLAGVAGQHFYFHGLSGNPSGSWVLYDPNNVSSGSASLAGDFDVVLPITGTYVLAQASFAPGPATEIFQVNPHNNGENQSINRGPILSHLDNIVLPAGALVTFTAHATDPDNNVLSFSLDPGSPGGAAINPTSGDFSWNPPITGLSSVTPITVRVADNGNPSLSAAQTMIIEVIAGPAMITVIRTNDLANPLWHSAPGKHYRLQFKNEIFDPAWQAVGTDVTATALITIQPDLTSATNTYRFYRIQALDPLQ